MRHRRGAEQIEILAGAAHQSIAVAAGKGIVPFTAQQPVAGVAVQASVTVEDRPVQQVIARTTRKRIAALPAEQAVVAVATVNQVVSVTARQKIVARIAVQGVVSAIAVQLIRTASAGQDIIAVTAMQPVTTASAIDTIVATVPQDKVVAAAAGHVVGRSVAKHCITVRLDWPG